MSLDLLTKSRNHSSLPPCRSNTDRPPCRCPAASAPPPRTPRSAAGKKPAQRPKPAIKVVFHSLVLLLHEKTSVPARLREPYRRKKGAKTPWCLGSRCGQERPRPSGHSDSSPRGSFTVTRSRGLFTPFPRSGFSPADGLDRYSFSQRSISPADCPIIKKFYPKSKSKSRGRRHARRLLCIPKSAAADFAHFPEKFGRAAFLRERSFSVKTKS